jgi:hypothetical protein
MVARLILYVALLAQAILSPALHAEEFTYTESDNDGNNIALGFPPPEPIDTTVAGDYFRSYDFLLARHQALMLDNATVRGMIVGQTWSGEDIWAYRLGDSGNTTVDDAAGEGAVLINGSIHAREWQTQEAVTGLLEHLVDIAGDEGIGSFLRDNLDIFILPVHNIDGFRQTQTYWNKVTNSEQQPRDGRMRRKNLHAPDDTTVDDQLATESDNLYGIDLNRNGAEGFGSNGGSSSDPTNLIYHGVAAASEPETQALLELAGMIPDGQLRFFEDVHSFSQLMFVPQTGDELRDEVARNLAHSMSSAVNNRYDVSPDPVNGSIGTMADYFAYTFGVPAWTLELEPRYVQGAVQYGGIGVSHDGFILPESEVARLRDEFNRMHTTVFYEMAGPAIAREIAIRRSDNGTVVYAAQWESDGAGTRQLNVTTDISLQPGIEYELWLAFSKPIHDATIDTAHGSGIHLSRNSDNENFIVSEVDWMAQPGGAFDGYRRYRNDAFRTQFTLPDDMPADGSAERRMLVIETIDMVGRRLDADPATIADFSNGKWTGFEHYPGATGGTTGDSAGEGNRDCNFVVSVATSNTVAAPADNRAMCAAYLNPVDHSLSAFRRNGGGAITWILMLTGLLLGARRARLA